MTHKPEHQEQCEGVEPLTPESTANRMGLEALRYRAGTHATFFETMRARLTTLALEVADETGQTALVRPLRELTTRENDDPAIAFLDAWAVVADILTFYQERIANEGYLRTLTELRSAVELARLIGYKPRPGVSASVPLAFTLQDGYNLMIPAGTRTQSIPGQDEMPQVFETSEELSARADLNVIMPRMVRPQYVPPINADDELMLYIADTTPTIQQNDVLLLVYEDQDGRVLQSIPRRVEDFTVEPEKGRTVLLLRTPPREDDGDEDGEPSEVSPGSAFRNALYNIIGSDAERDFYYVFRDLRDVNARGEVAFAIIETMNDQAYDFDITVNELYQRLVETWFPGLRDLHAEARARDDMSLVFALRSLIPLLEELADEYRDHFVRPPAGRTTFNTLSRSLTSLKRPPSSQPANRYRLTRGQATVYDQQSDALPQLLIALNPELDKQLYTAWANTPVNPAEVVLHIERMKARAAIFGHNAPLQPQFSPGGEGSPPAGTLIGYNEWPLSPPGNTMQLDREYPGVAPGSRVVVQRSGTTYLEVYTVEAVDMVSVTEFGLWTRVTQLTLDRTWLSGGEDLTLAAIRDITVYVDTERLPRADEAISDDVTGDRVEVDRVYEDLEPGRWLIVAGERCDVPGADGVQGAELVMLSNVTQSVQEVPRPPEDRGDYHGHGYGAAYVSYERRGEGETLRSETQPRPDDTVHSTLVFANALAYCYKRGTVKIYGNVVMSTHGETHKDEVLGSGDGAKANQQFTLKQNPLTFVSAETPSGIESTVVVRVDGVAWDEAPNLFEMKPGDREYQVTLNTDGQATVTFGDGERGARPPGGVENITATYRTGIGQPGNVNAEQISQLLDKPLGVTGVLNPTAATGGANPDGRNDIQRNAPLAVLALDRLVSVQDHADFARTFAGVSKANATLVSNGVGEVVYVTISGTDDIPIGPNSDLLNNLHHALRTYGDDHLAVRVAVRELLHVFINARVRVKPAYRWDLVAPKVRAALLDTFSYTHRDLAQPLYESEVIRAIQQVPGVLYTDLEILTAVPASATPEQLELFFSRLLGAEIAAGDETLAGIGYALRGDLPVRPARAVNGRTGRTLMPAQLAYLSDAVPNALVLTEIK